MTYQIISMITVLVVASGSALATPDPLADQFNPFGLPVGSTPDLIEVSAVRTVGSINITLTATAPVYAADDFDHFDAQILGRIEFGVGDDGAAGDSFKSQWYSAPSNLDVSAYLSLDEVLGGQVPLYDDAFSLLALLPIVFDGESISVDVPENMLPVPAGGFDVVVHNPDQTTWDVFPNGPGYAGIVPEPSSLALLTPGLLLCAAFQWSGRNSSSLAIGVARPASVPSRPDRPSTARERRGTASSGGHRGGSAPFKRCNAY